MRNTKTIENYDINIGAVVQSEDLMLQQTETDLSPHKCLSIYRGMDIKNKHYIVNAVDCLAGTDYFERGRHIPISRAVYEVAGGKSCVRVPKRAYAVVSYDKDTRVAVVTEIQDEALIEEIVAGLAEERAVVLGLKWLAENKPEAFHRGQK